MWPGLVQARLESAGGAECGATAVEMVLPTRAQSAATAEALAQLAGASTMTQQPMV